VPVPEEAELKRVSEKLARYRHQMYNPVPIRDFEYKVRRHINEYLTPPKNRYKLANLLDCLQRFKNDLKDLVRIDTQRDLNEALEVENILDSAYLSTLASLERKESRWGFWHQRGDFPARDDQNWLKHIDLKMNPNTKAPEISHRCVGRIHDIGDMA
jgi:succinate dehydrogenase/fumarate reductase flavoprotein subunit